VRTRRTEMDRESRLHTALTPNLVLCRPILPPGKQD
jgi:hypothetical protein